MTLMPSTSSDSQFRNATATLELRSALFGFRHTPFESLKATGSEQVTADLKTSQTKQWTGPPCFPIDARAFSPSATARIVVVVGSEAQSPFESESWESVMRHMVSRFSR